MAGGREYDQNRFENLVLYFAERSRDDLGYGKVKLNKLLFRADFESYRLLGTSISGETYKAEELGPVAVHLPRLLERLEQKEVLTVREVPAGPYERKVPEVQEGHGAKLDLFSLDERQIMKRTFDELRPHGGKSVSLWSHEASVGWRAKIHAKKGRREIPYSSAPLSIRPLSAKAARALRARFAASG